MKKWIEEKEVKNLEVEKNEWKVQMQNLQDASMETNKTGDDFVTQHLFYYIILRSFGLTLWPMFGLECYGQISMTCYVMALSASACALFPVYYRKIRVLWANRYDLLRIRNGS
ncbi:hypothetical protein G9A89_003843 [Geosiphon pyriformis]|nr:hypothetical protein G9A89_003843 [Geosiphon pyriformis]